jgi:hydrogenase maturation factor
MCIARVGKVTRLARGRASVSFFDGRTSDSVDVSMLKAKEGSFVEVFGSLAISVLPEGEARSRRAAWAEIRRAARQD